MALTPAATPTANTVIGDLRAVFTSVTFDNAYATGGTAVTPSAFGLQTVVSVLVPANGNRAGSRLVIFDPTTAKLKLFTAIGTEASNATDQSSIVADVIVIGKG